MGDIFDQVAAPAATSGGGDIFDQVGASAPTAKSDATFDIGAQAGQPVQGMVQRGNIDVNHRPSIANADGTHSSIYSMTVPIDTDGTPWKGAYEKAPQYALVPSIANGKFLTPDGKIPAKGDKKANQALEDAATDYYNKTREHLGIFSSGDAADAYAGATHAYMNDGTDAKVYAPSPPISFAASGPPVGMRQSPLQSATPTVAPEAHPAVEMTPVNRVTGAPLPGSSAYARLSHNISAVQGQDAEDEAQAAQDFGGVTSAKTTATGVGNLVAADRAYEQSGAPQASMTGAPVDQAKLDQARKQALVGATQTIAGGGSLAMTLGAPEVAGIFRNAIAGDLPSQIALAKLSAYVAGGTAASGATSAVATHYNVSPEAKDLMATAAFFIPSLFGLAGVKEGLGVDAQGNPAYSARTPGEKVGLGVVQSPEATEVRAGVKGVGSVGVRIPRAPSAVDITAKDLLDTNTQTMQDSAKADAAAQLIVRGASPQEAVAAQQPKAPPTLQQQAGAALFPSPAITQQHMGAVAQIIKSLPEADQPQAMLEAHANLAKQIGQWQTFTGPDGKIYTVSKPADAVKYATQFANAAVDAHDAAVADAQKQNEVATKQAQADATKAQSATSSETSGKSKLQAAKESAQLARVGTIIESQVPAGYEDNAKVIRSVVATHLGISDAEAQPLIDKYRASKIPTVGSAAEPVVEESPDTIDAQMAALKAGTIRVVHVPAGGKYMPTQPAGIQKVTTPSSDPGAGTYFFKPGKGLRAETIKTASKAGTHGDLTGHIQTKEDIAAAPQTVAVVAHKPDGTEIQASEVDASKPNIVAAQAAILHERHPDAQISVKPIDDVISDRLAAQQPKGDIFDQAAAEPKPLPKEIAGSKPRYGYKDKNFELKFADPRDLAAYTATQKTPNKAHDRFVDYLRGEGFSDESIQSHGAKVQATIKEMAKTAKPEDGPLAIPSQSNDQVSGGESPAKEEKGGVDEVTTPKAQHVAGEPDRTPATPEEPTSVAEPKHKYDFGSTQANLPADSDASKAIDAIRAKIDPKDFAGKGDDIGDNHVTVRYGIQGGDVDGIRAYLKAQAPFDAHLGTTEAFPPSKNSDGAAVLISPIESPELHRMNVEIAKHGDFKEPDFAEYRPHVTIAYVKPPEAAEKYVGLDDAKGKSFRIESVEISDRDGNLESVKLEGSAKVESVTPKEGTGEISTQPKEETPAGVPSYEELVEKRNGVPRNLMAPDVSSNEQFLRNARISVPDSPKAARELVDKVVRERYSYAVKLFRDIPQQIEAYRAIDVPNGIEDIKRDALGRYWSDKESGAQSYHTNVKGGKTVILKGTIDKGQLDATHTILARMRSATGHDEGELNLKSGEQAANVSYKLLGEKDWKPLSESSPAPAKGAEPFAPKKGDRIRYTAKDGTEKVGILKQETALGVRVAPDGGGSPDFISKKKILGPVQSEPKSETKPAAVAKVESTSPDEPVTFVRKSLQAGKEETFTLPGKKAATLADHLYDLIQANKMPKDNNALRAIVAEYDGKPVDNARLKEAQEAMEEALVKTARTIVDGGYKQDDTFEALVRLYNRQPNLNIRTSTSMAEMAYSTPAPLAYVASRLAGIGGKTTVYEPTAGNGMLLIGAQPNNVTANELNPERAKALKAQGFDVTVGDALQNNVKPKSMDAVITNPPFGSIKDEDTGKTLKLTVDGYKIGQIDHLISARALDAMKDDGKATIILGADKVAGGVNTDARLFFNWLYSHYNVSSHFEVDGDLYGRQGANWPVRVINVDGRVRSDRFSPEPGTIQRVKTWKEVYGKLDEGLAAHGQGSLQPLSDGSVQQSGNEPATVPVGTRKPSIGTGGSGPGRGKGASVGLARKQPEPLPDSELDNAGGLASTDNDVRPDADASRSDQLPAGAKPEPPAKRDAKPSGDSGDSLTDPDNAYQVKYTPASSKKDEGVLIPSNMRAPWEHAMRVLEDEVGDLDKYVADQLGYDDLDDMHDALMGLQVDSVAAAIHQMSKGKAIVIADQTGIGKGRQAAALIRWAINHDKIPVFMTAKPSLFTDMFGDLADIGSGDVQPFIVNLDESISLPNGTKAFGNSQRKGVHKGVLDKIVSSGELPDGRNAVFMTYSQINTDNLQRDALRAIAHNAVMILDEAHTAAGESNTGEYMQGVLAEAPHVTYLSATFAKRPDNMPLYFRTDIGTAIKDGDKLQEAMSLGGLPLQTVISTNLVKAGQLARRERSYDGVDISTNVDTARHEEHTKLADQVTTALRAIVKADKLFHNIYVKSAQKQAKQEGMSATGGGNKASSTIAHAEFTSIVHNFVRQMLLALKADSAADEAIAAIKRGEKPLIAVEQTMGSFLSEYAAHNGIQDGAPLGDFTYRTVLKRALDRTRYIVVKDRQGNDVKHYIPMEDLDDVTKAGYRKAQEVIDNLKMDLPMSPIDWIRQRITDAGHSISEITGRSLAVDYSDPKNPTLTQVPVAERTDKVLTTRRFNDGRLDAILLNVAGSTGISLHASEKFKDQRVRHMIVAQPAQDINIFMQMLGRIHRTGQVKLPRYTILAVDLPAEKRPTALLSKKMNSLNANTSSNTESATSVKAADMLNKYGDEIVARYLEDNPELVNQLGVTPMDGDRPKQDIARDVTGKLAITPVKTQTAFYGEVEQAYNDHIDYLNETGQNELEPRTLDYDAKETRSQVLSVGEDKSSPFGEDSIYGEYSIKAQSKPITPDQVKERIATSLGGATPQAHANALSAGLDVQLKEWQKTLDPVGATLSHSYTVAQTGRAFIQQHRIGQALRLEINGDMSNAAVINIESNHKGGGNPFALSKIIVTLATTGANPMLKVPGTQLAKITLSAMYGDAPSFFEIRNPNAREQAKIITGNLLAAYGELKDSRGTIINFTKADGSMEMGILLPKKFDVKVNTVGDHLMKSAQHVVKFLRNGSEDAQTIGVSSRDGNVRIVMRKGEMQVVTPKAKASGGKYFLDKKLTAVTGDFVSSGTSMRASVPYDKQAAAVAEVMKKAALYVPRSLADEAINLEPKIGEAPAKPTSSTTMRASLFGVDLLAEAIGRTVKVAWDKDVAPHLPAIGKGIGDAAVSITHLVVPTAGANVDVLDASMRLKGDQEKQRFAVEQMFKGISKMWDSVPEQSRIDFLDNYKTGKPQATPELDQLAALYKKVDDATYRRIVDAQVGNMEPVYRKLWSQLSASEKNDFFDKVMDGKDIAKPGDEAAMKAGDKSARLRLRLQAIKDNTLTFKADHFRSFWKVVPGSLEERTPDRTKRGPLRGDRGMLKRSTLPDVSTGIDNGGVLVSTNPQKLFEMAQSSSLRYITAQNWQTEMGDLGMRKFVRDGERGPDGWETIPDSIADVYFPVDALTVPKEKLPDLIAKDELGTRRSIIHSGKWYYGPSAARLMSNYLSKNWFQTNAVGRGLMAVKNLTTAIELSLSPFHLVFESLEAIGSQFGLGLMHAMNVGVGQGKLSGFLESGKAIAGAPLAPFTLSRTGGSAIKATADFLKFSGTDRGKAFLKAFPDAPHLIDLAFTGGLTMGMPADYRVNLMESARAAMTDKNYFGALVRAVPGSIQAVMNPLFEKYIPRLKMGFFLQAMSQQMAEKHDALMNGEISEAELARTVVNSVENRFGELNFSNLWLDNTFKGAAQFMFRSVTWKLGNWRGATTGVADQAKALADPLKTMYEDVRGNRKGTNRTREEYIPKLDLNMSWLIGMAMTTAVMGTILSKLLSGKYPWEWLDQDEEEGMSAAGALALEMAHPRTGDAASYTGKPVRLSLPTGLKDFEHGAEDPRGYLRSSESGFVGKTLDTWDNKDAFGNYVYDPNGTAYRKLADILTYNAPQPITAQTLEQGAKTGDWTRAKLGAFGLTRAPGDLDLTPLEKHMEGVAKAKHTPETPEDREAYQAKMQGIRNGTITGPEKQRALKEARKPYLLRMFDKLSYLEAKNAYMNYANEEEQRELRGALAQKRANALRRNPSTTRNPDQTAQ